LQLRPLHLLDVGGGRLRDRRRLELSPGRGRQSGRPKGGGSVKARCSFARYICSTLVVVGFSINPS
jgi:hypothetical protein